MPPANPYTDLFHACRTKDIPAWLLMGVSYETSKFRPDARGGAGEVGLMQLLPEYFGGCGNLSDPRTNICCGAAGIQKQYDKVAAIGAATWADRVRLALMANNMGASFVVSRLPYLSPRTWATFKAATPGYSGKHGWVEQMFARGQEYRRAGLVTYGLVAGAVLGAGLILWATIR